VVQEVLREGSEMGGGFDQPLQHRVGVDLEHAGDRTDAQAFGQSTNRPYEHIGGYPLPMHWRAMRLKKIPATFTARELSPGTTTGMPVGRDIAQSKPATIATVGIRTEMLRGV